MSRWPQLSAAVILFGFASTEGGSLSDANAMGLSPSQWAEYQADVPKTILELQPYRRSASVEFNDSGQNGTATLIDLNPQINAWFLLTLRWEGTGKSLSYHLENPQPRIQTLSLDQSDPYGIRLSGNGPAAICHLWRDTQASPLQKAQRTDLPYGPLCADRLYLRNSVAGTYTHLERVTNFLRDHVWGGERIVGFVRDQFFSDAFVESNAWHGATNATAAKVASQMGPRPPMINAGFAAMPVNPEHLGIDIGQRIGAVVMGQWYPVHNATGIFISIVQPKAIDSPALDGKKAKLSPLDPIEGAALDYMVAMDLAQFDLGFALGTDHPRVRWSERVPATARDPRLEGPDGIGIVSPLIVNGIVNPAAVERVAVAFAGGFKREHGAFRFGPLAQVNHGTHYGFIEQGVVFSKLQAALSTLLVTGDGDVQMKTWVAANDPPLSDIRFARQNGVPLIEYDEKTGNSSPGALVGNWGAGNWSGSDDERLRTLRAGVCLQTEGARKFLIFGYFSTATPRAMAHVFQGYHCRYAMHLDMNALEHTYFAIYTHREGRIVVQHLIEGMEAVDRKGGTELAPRFLSFPDDRDFFYLTRKGGVS